MYHRQLAFLRDGIREPWAALRVRGSDRRFTRWLGRVGQAGLSELVERDAQAGHRQDERGIEVFESVVYHHRIFNSKARQVAIPAARSAARHQGAKYGPPAEGVRHLKP